MSHNRLRAEAPDEHHFGDSDVVLIPVSALAPADSPRLGGLSEEHARMLAESGAALPPILVQRSTMRVIDGMHRIRACQINGVLSVAARLLDEADDMAFMRSVHENVSHGLPLSLEDRRAAAGRLLAMFPHWSDRALGRASGLSGKTVAALRRRSNDAIPQQRTGQDGRVRPLNSDRGRRLAETVIEQRPDASLREVARLAGVSPNTVRSIRVSLQNRATETRAVSPSYARYASRLDASGVQSALVNLSRDPSLRYTESGRTLLRVLHQQFGMPSGPQVIETLPPHCLPGVAQLARILARHWDSLSDLATSRSELEIP
jgi:ParB-like chromosome segregation protein Spo0J